jgi:very-short-patch-repair endonuclease
VPTDLTAPFRGSAAVAAGSLTRGVLRGPRYRRLFPDVYAPAALEPDLALRARAAGVLVDGRGVVSGWSAAELLGASCAPRDPPAEVLLTVPHAQTYRCTRLRVHRDAVAPGETTRLHGTPLTTPVRTAYDLARWAPSLTERVVAVDAVAHCCGIDPGELVELRHRHLGARGSRGITEVLRLVDARSESPMESRIRVPLVLAGSPPVVQHPVTVRGRSYRLDLAYPEHRLAIEYDGAHHRHPERARRDLVREADLAAAGWTVFRFDAATVLSAPWRIVAAVAARLGR